MSKKPAFQQLSFSARGKYKDSLQFSKGYTDCGKMQRINIDYATEQPACFAVAETVRNCGNIPNSSNGYGGIVHARSSSRVALRMRAIHSLVLDQIRKRLIVSDKYGKNARLGDRDATIEDFIEIEECLDRNRGPDLIALLLFPLPFLHIH